MKGLEERKKARGVVDALGAVIEEEELMEIEAESLPMEAESWSFTPPLSSEEV